MFWGFRSPGTQRGRVKKMIAGPQNEGHGLKKQRGAQEKVGRKKAVREEREK